MSTNPLANSSYDLSSIVDPQLLDSSFVDVDVFFPQSDNCSTSSNDNVVNYRQPLKSRSSASDLHFPSSVSESSNSPSRTLAAMGSSVGPSNLDPQTIQHLIEEQNLKKQRLARKAELARMTRKRKKERLTELEIEVKRLKAEISCLRKRNAEIMEMSRSGQNILVDELVVEEQKNLQKAIEKVVYASGLEGQELDSTNLPNLVEELMEVFAKKTLTSKSHLYSLEACLSPCMPLRFLNWAMCQDDKFYQDPQGLWNCLFKQQLGLSEEQIQHVLSLRSEMKKQREMAGKVEEVYKKFKPMVERHLLQSDDNLDRLRSCLTPDQLAKFFVWVEQNQLCVKMLESVMH